MSAPKRWDDRMVEEFGKDWRDHDCASYMRDELRDLRAALAIESAALADAVRHVSNLKERAALQAQPGEAKDAQQVVEQSPYEAITLANLRAGKLSAARVYVGYCELSEELKAANGAIKRYQAQAAPAPFTADDVTQEFTLDTIVSGLLHDCEHGPEVWRAALDEYIRVERNLADLAKPAPATLSDDAAEGLEILDSLIENIEAQGNYSKHTTIGFLQQIRQCIAAASSSQEDAKDAVIATVTISKWRGLENTEFQLQADLPDGTHNLYLEATNGNQSRDSQDAARYRLIKSKIGLYAGWWQVQIRPAKSVPLEDIEIYFERDIDAALAAKETK
jgi:hypothetical protein